MSVEKQRLLEEQTGGEDASNKMPGTDGYIFVIRDPGKTFGEFLLGTCEEPVRDIHRVNAPWSPEMQRYHPLTLSCLVRTLNMSDAFELVRTTLVKEIGMTECPSDASNRCWMQNPLSKTVHQVSQCIKKVILRWHALLRDRVDNTIEVKGYPDAPESVTVGWKYVPGRVTTLEALESLQATLAAQAAPAPAAEPDPAPTEPENTEESETTKL